MRFRKIHFIILFLILLTTSNKVSATMKLGGYQFLNFGINQGELYSRSAFPLCVETDINYQPEDLTDLKKSDSVSRNFLKLVEVGDSGIHQAMKKGKVNKTSIVTTRIHKINIPTGFIIPLYFKETKTVIYGTKKDEI